MWQCIILILSYCNTFKLLMCFITTLMRVFMLIAINIQYLDFCFNMMRFRFQYYQLAFRPVSVTITTTVELLFFTLLGSTISWYTFKYATNRRIVAKFRSDRVLRNGEKNRADKKSRLANHNLSAVASYARPPAVSINSLSRENIPSLTPVGPNRCWLEGWLLCTAVVILIEHFVKSCWRQFISFLASRNVLKSARKSCLNHDNQSQCHIPAVTSRLYFWTPTED